MSNAIETAKFLRRYQSWRKGEIDVFYPDSHAGPNPVEISAAIDRAIAALEAQPPCGADGAVTFALDYYDAGLLGDGGGGNVEWWQDYMRSELSRAHDCYQSQIDANHQPAAPVAPIEASHPNCNYRGWLGRVCAKCGEIHNEVPPQYLFGEPDVDAAPVPAQPAVVPEGLANAVLANIAAIAHCGGLAKLDNENALSNIRQLSKPWCDNTGTLRDLKNRVDAAILSTTDTEGRKDE